jgi:hypothetical protein
VQIRKGHSLHGGDLDDGLQPKREFEGGTPWPEQANEERIRDTRGQGGKP